MTEPAFDLSQALYELGDQALDGQVGAAQVQALLARMPGGGQLQADGSPAAASVLTPQGVLPREEPDEPRSLAQLEQDLPGLVKGLDAVFAQPTTMQNHQRQEDAREELLGFVDEYNKRLDLEAAERLGEAPPPPADLGALLQEAQEAAYGDPGSVDQFALAERVNAALSAHSRAAEREQDALMASLAAKAKQKRQQAAGRGR